MKKYIGKIGALLIGLSLIACTKDVDVLEPNLDGVYQYKSAAVSIPVKTGKEDVYYGDLTLVPGKECLWDNNWEFLNGKAILREGETSCGDTFQEESKNAIIGSFDCIYDKDDQVIKMISEGKVTQIWKNVKIGYSFDGKQTLSFELWDNDIQQVVKYYLQTK